MQRIVMGVFGLLLMAGAGTAWAEGQHQHGSTSGGQQTLTGEVVDVFCYLSHPDEGLGKKHAGCAKKCIGSGMPVAIKVGGQLYLATMSDHAPANQTLVPFAGEQVTVEGTVMEQDGQHLIAIKHVEKAK